MTRPNYPLAFALLMLLMIVPDVCYANITLHETSALPGDGFYSETPFPRQTIPVAAVADEVNYLNKNKMFDQKSYNVFLYNYLVYRMSDGCKVPYGGTAYSDNIYIFSGVWDADTVSSAVVHEIGHMVRHYYLSDNDLQTYLTNRGVKDGELLHGCASIKEELFAEDFRTLFGDSHAQAKMYKFYDDVPPPSAKDQEFILGCIDRQATPVSLASAKLPS